MSEITVSEQHRQAIELHQKIIVSANLAQQNIWDMCNGLKTMRDNKLYKELGYQNFDDYCETEVGFNRTQAHKYISIIENTSENVYSSKHLGVSKLYLLSTISEPEQDEIAEKLDLENTTVKQLKAEIDRLKDEKQEALRKQKEEYEERLKNVQTADGSSDDKDVFKAYFSIAYDSFVRMLDFAKQSQDKEFFKGKVEHLITALATQNINL